MFNKSLFFTYLGLLLTLATTLAAPSTPSVNRVALNQAKREAIVQRASRSGSGLARRASSVPVGTFFAVFADTFVGGSSQPNPAGQAGVAGNTACINLCNALGSSQCTFTRYVVNVNNPSTGNCNFRRNPEPNASVNEGTSSSFKDQTCAEVRAMVAGLDNSACVIEYL